MAQIDTSNAQVAYDEYGQPFIILRDQGKFYNTFLFMFFFSFFFKSLINYL